MNGCRGRVFECRGRARQGARGGRVPGVGCRV